jgi:hypothetical protein
MAFGVVFRTVFALSKRFRNGFGDGPANSAYGFEPVDSLAQGLRGPIRRYLLPSGSRIRLPFAFDR